MIRTFFLSALALVLASGAAAQNNVVITTAVPFLQIEPDSRAAGMGMTGVAIADNAYAPYWNPAGLAGQEGTEVSFTHAPWLPALGADLSYEYLSGKHSMGKAGDARRPPHLLQPRPADVDRRGRDDARRVQEL